LLSKNAKVYLAARSEDRAKAAIEDLKQTTGKEAIFLKLDLSSLNSIKAAAEEFLGCVLDGLESQYLTLAFTRKESELHVLFNNACVSLSRSEGSVVFTFQCSGLMAPPIDQLTADGYDMTWGTNTLGMKLFIDEHSRFEHILRTRTLLLYQTAPSRPLQGFHS
jgi:retinol dehydrogenase-12